VQEQKGVAEKTERVEQVVGVGVTHSMPAVACSDKEILQQQVTQEIPILKISHTGSGSLQVPYEFQYPITLELIADPVVSADGHTYERQAIGDSFEMNGDHATSPTTALTLRDQRSVAAPKLLAPQPAARLLTGLANHQRPFDRQHRDHPWHHLQKLKLLPGSARWTIHSKSGSCRSIQRSKPTQTICINTAMI
jgi:hypothetical protein